MYKMRKMRKVLFVPLMVMSLAFAQPLQMGVGATEAPQLLSVFEDFESLEGSAYSPWLIVDNDPQDGFDFIAPILGCTSDGVACTSLENEDGVTFGRAMFDGTKERPSDTWYMAAFQVMPGFGGGLGMSTPTQETSWVMEWRARYNMDDGSAGGWFTKEDFSTGFGYNWLGESAVGDLTELEGLTASATLNNVPTEHFNFSNKVDPSEWNTYRQTWYIDNQGNQNIEFEVVGVNGTTRKVKNLDFTFNTMYSTFWVDNQVDLMVLADVDAVQYQDIDWIHVYQIAGRP